MKPIVALSLMLCSLGRGFAAPRRAIVLGAGGAAGVGWEIGVLTGLSDAGINPLDVDFILGTSAGASVAAQLTSGLDWTTLFQRQLEPVDGELDSGVNLTHAFATLAFAIATAPNEGEARRRVGALALAATTVSEPSRRAAIASRLPTLTWPSLRIGIVAVDATTGLHQLFERSTGVDLVDAVTASCAVPTIWPAATVGGHRYMDGGARTYENADLALGYDRVLVLSTRLSGKPVLLGGDLDSQLAPLRQSGAQIIVIQPDAAAAVAMGSNFLDPRARAPSARAGRIQGHREAANAVPLWQ